MNTKIKLVRGNVDAPALNQARMTLLKANHAAQLRRDGRVPKPARKVLYAVWHVNRATGRLECRWSEQNVATDEGVSCGSSFRCAA